MNKKINFIYYNRCCTPLTRDTCKNHFGVNEDILETAETMYYAETVHYFEEVAPFTKREWDILIEWARTRIKQK